MSVRLYDAIDITAAVHNFQNHEITCNKSERLTHSHNLFIINVIFRPHGYIADPQLVTNTFENDPS